MMRAPTRLLAAAAVTFGSLGGAVPAVAHVHHVDNRSHSQQLANGQNHAPFVFNAGSQQFESCGQVDPAGYGLETAHHGADQGKPGKADGCYALSTPPLLTDRNPAID
jgi:hypothetical protein